MTNSSAHKDRTAWLIGFGLFELLVALFFLMMLAFMILASLAPGGFPQDAAGPNPMGQSRGALLGGSLVYLVMAGAFAALGVGSMLCRRWARALSLIAAWAWLVCGVFGILALIVMRPWMQEMMSQVAATAPNGGTSVPDVGGLVLGCMAGVFGVFGIVVPGVMVLLYRSPEVIATCEEKDPVPRWTDLRPLPVLALALMLTWPLLSVLYLPFSGGVAVLFGQVLRGPPAWLSTLAVAAISAWCAWRVWQLDIRGWWGGLVLWSVLSASYVLLILGDGQTKLFEASGMPQEQLDLMSGFRLEDFWAISAVSFLALLVFFLYVKQFMRTPGAASTAS